MTPEEIATTSLQERLILARSADTTDEILMLLAQDKKVDVRRGLTERKDISDNLMKQIVNDKSKDVRLRIAKHPDLNAEFQEILAGSREVAIRVALALRDDAPDDILLKLAASNNRDVGLAIVKRSTLSDELLEQLAIHRCADVKCFLARRDDVSEDLLLKMSASDTWSVGMALLECKSLSGKYLNQLANHKNMHVRMELARREDLPESILAVLFEDKSPAVVAAIAQRRNLSAEQIEKLSNHKSKYVRADIAARKDLPHHLIEKLSADKHVEVLHAIANRGNLSEQFIKQMLSNCTAKRRVRLAMKEPLPSNVIHELALDEDEQVRAAIAARSDITESMIDTFVTDSSAIVQLAVACRSDLSKQKSKNILSQLNVNGLDRKRLILYIKKMSGAYLNIENRKLVINDSWKSEGAVNFDECGRLLPLLFLYPESKNIEEIVINTETNPYSFDLQLCALSNLKEQPGIKQISLNLVEVNLSWARCSNLNNINKQRFPNLEKLSISYSGVSFNLDLPNLKEISITSSGDDFHKILLILLNSNLQKLERISISAGCYDSGSHQDQVMNVTLGDAHEVWPNLKSLVIGTRSSYDWNMLFSSPLFKQLDELEINLDEYYNKDWDEWFDLLRYSDEGEEVYQGEDFYEAEVAYEKRVVESLTENITNLLDALVDQSGDLKKIGVVRVGIGSDIIGYIDEYASGIDIDIQEILKQKVSKLKKLYNFNVEYPVYVGGYE